MAFSELGRTYHTGMGEVPLPFTEIEAYSRAAGGFTGIEARTIRAMSEAYLSGKARGADVLARPPWDGS